MAKKKYNYRMTLDKSYINKDPNGVHYGRYLKVGEKVSNIEEADFNDIDKVEVDLQIWLRDFEAAKGVAFYDNWKLTIYEPNGKELSVRINKDYNFEITLKNGDKVSTECMADEESVFLYIRDYHFGKLSK